MSTKRREYEYGQIVSVDVVPLGDNLAADVSAGATSITVEDASDFDEDGGSLLLAGTVYAYSTWTEDDATGVGTITLTGAAVAANAFEGDAVAVYDPLYLVAASDKVAQIAVVGDDGNVDMLEAAIALHLVDKIDEGVRGPQGEQVKLELEGDEWVVVDVEGLGDPGSSGDKFRNTDAFTVVTNGAQAMPLTFEPIPGSEHLNWHPAAGAGIRWAAAEWSRAGSTVTIPDPDSIIKAGDKFTMEYAYRVGAISPAQYPVWSGLNDIQIPDGTEAGDLVLIVMALKSTGSITAANGYATVGQTATITHATGIAGTQTYRTIVLSKIKANGDSVPTFNNGGNDAVVAVLAFHGKSSVRDSAFDTVADAASANTPAMYPFGDVRVWGTLSAYQAINPSSGQVLANVGGLDFDLCVTTGPHQSAAVAASVSGEPGHADSTAGWMLATLSLS